MKPAVLPCPRCGDLVLCRVQATPYGLKVEAVRPCNMKRPERAPRRSTTP